MSTTKRAFFDLFRPLPPRGVNPLYPLPPSRTVPDRQSNILPLLGTPFHQSTTPHIPRSHRIHQSVFSQRVMNGGVFVVMQLMILMFFLYIPCLTVH